MVDNAVHSVNVPSDAWTRSATDDSSEKVADAPPREQDTACERLYSKSHDSMASVFKCFGMQPSLPGVLLPPVKALLQRLDAEVEYDRFRQEVKRESRRAVFEGKWSTLDLLYLVKKHRAALAARSVAVFVCVKPLRLQLVDRSRCGSWSPATALDGAVGGQLDTSRQMRLIAVGAAKDGFEEKTMPGGVFCQQLEDRPGRMRFIHDLPLGVRQLVERSGAGELARDFTHTVSLSLKKQAPNDIGASTVSPWDNFKVLETIDAYNDAFRKTNLRVFLCSAQAGSKKFEYELKWLEYVDLAVQPQYRPSERLKL